MSSPNIPANITIQDIYDAIRPTWDVDGDIKDAVAKEFKKVTELQEDNERLQEELEGKEVLAKAYKEHKIEIMKLKEERNIFEVEFHKTLQHQADDTEEYEKQIKKLKAENEELKEEKEELYDYEGAITCLGLIDGDEYNKVVAEKKELFKSLMKTKSIATELYREMKYALGYGEFDEPNRQNMYDHIKQLNERLMNERLMTPKEMSDKIDEVLS